MGIAYIGSNMLDKKIAYVPTQLGSTVSELAYVGVTVYM